MKSKPPSNTNIRKYPTKEVDGWVWIYPGNDTQESESDTTRQPGFYLGHGGPLEPSFKFYYDLDVDHSLLIENFLDPAHLPFTHDTTIGKNMAATPMSVSCEFTPEGWLRGDQRTPENNSMIPTRFEFIPPMCVALTFDTKTKIDQVWILTFL